MLPSLPEGCANCNSTLRQSSFRQAGMVSCAVKGSGVSKKSVHAQYVVVHRLLAIQHIAVPGDFFNRPGRFLRHLGIRMT